MKTSMKSRIAEILRFAFTGGICFLIEYAALVLLKEWLHMDVLIATPLAFLISVIVNYLMCVRWVFSGAQEGSRKAQIGFVITSGIGLALNWAIMALLTALFGEDKTLFTLPGFAVKVYMVNKVVATLLVMIWNYVTKRMLLKKKPEAERPVIFFDWDGTIADSMPLCIGEISLALERMGLPIPPVERLKACNGPTYEESVAVLGLPPEQGEEFLRLRKEAEMELVPTVQQFFPGVREMLDELRTFADLAVISNGLPEYIELSARVMKVEDVFVRLQAHIPGKTKAEALGMLISEMQPSRCVMVGDRLGDIEAGKANGIPTVAACYGFGNDAEYSQADYRVDSAEEMTALLKKLLG